MRSHPADFVLVEGEVFEHTADVLDVLSTWVVFEVLLVNFAGLIDFVAFVVKAAKSDQCRLLREDLCGKLLRSRARLVRLCFVRTRYIPKAANTLGHLRGRFLGLAQQSLGCFEIVRGV